MSFKLAHVDTVTSQTYEHWVLEYYDRWMADGLIDAHYELFKNKATADANGGCVRKIIRLSGDDVTTTSSEALIETKIRAGIHKVDGVDVDFTAAADV